MHRHVWVPLALFACSAASPSSSVRHQACEQESVDLRTNASAGVVKGHELRVQYRPEAGTRLTVQNDGVVTITGFSKSESQYRTAVYALEEIRFLNPSKTRIDGTGAAMEVRLIHRHRLRGVLAFSVLFDIGRSSPPFIRSLPWSTLRRGRTKKLERTVDPTTIMPPTVAYHTYRGVLVDSELLLCSQISDRSRAEQEWSLVRQRRDG